MTMLTKTVRYVSIAGSPGSPGSAGQPYLPARTISESTTVCVWVSQNINAYYGWLQQKQIDTANGYSGSSYPAPPSSSGDYNYVCGPVVSQLHLPAQPYIAPTPGVPASASQTFTDFQLGWTGRATSLSQMPGNGAYTFSAPASNVGAVVGLSTAVLATGYADIQFGFYLAGGIARIYESGIEVANLGRYLSADVFSVQRSSGQISYAINAVVRRQSPAPLYTMGLSASLYAGGDSVILSPFTAIAETGSGAGSLAPLQALGGSASATGAIGRGLLSSLTGQASVGSRGTATLPALKGVGGNTAYAIGAGALLSLTGFGEGYSNAPAYSIGSGSFNFMAGVGSGLTGEIGEARGLLSGMESTGADYNYAGGHARLVPLAGYASAFEVPGHALLFSGARALAQSRGFVDMHLVMRSTAATMSILVPRIQLDEYMHSTGHVSSSLLAQQVVTVLLASAARINATQFDNEDSVDVWALNTVNMGTTRYQNYSYNSFAKLGGKYYGAKHDGIFELRGSDDDGMPVDALINLGNMDFGTTLLKGIRECYIGVASDSAIVVKVVANAQTYFYTARSSSTTMSTQRVDMGRGLRANFYELELRNANGGDFELSSIEFTPVPLSRRI